MSDTTPSQLATEALTFLEAGNHKWIDRAWSIYYSWPKDGDADQKEILRNALGKMQMCHTGDTEDPSVASCRTILESVAARGD